MIVLVYNSENIDDKNGGFYLFTAANDYNFGAQMNKRQQTGKRFCS